MEGLVLAAVGALIGVGIAYAGVTLFNLGIADTNPPFWIDIRIDLKVLGFVSLLAVASALLSTVLPALKVTRGGAGEILKDQGRGTTSVRAGLASRLLVGFAVTLSISPLASCSLKVARMLLTARSASDSGKVNPIELSDDA